MVRYVALRVRAVPVDRDASVNAQRYAQAEADLEKSDYSAVRKCFASLRAATTADEAVRFKPSGQGIPMPTVPNPDVISYKAASLIRASQHLMEMLHDPTIPPAGFYAIANDLFDFAERDESGEKRVFAPLAAAFASGPSENVKETASLRMVEGMLWIHYGWRARTSQWASDVTDEGWQLFGKRLEKAQTALERAYELDPSEPLVCNCMLVVELGRGEEREEMETWFRRAMDADPDNQDACRKKMYYLEPKWHGSEEDMRVFGRECLATGNWDAGLPWLLKDAHDKFAMERFDRSLEEHDAYWRRPDVWDDLQQLYEAALAARPDSTKIRSGYANAAFDAGRWKLADDLLTALGNKADMHALGGGEHYAFVRRVAAERARQE